jgi:hypothetical protein
MDSTGHLYRGDEIAEAEKKRKDLIPVPDREVAGVMGMNRKQRRQWYREQRRAMKQQTKAR